MRRRFDPFAWPWNLWARIIPWLAARCTSTTAPTTADGGRLVREADCTTAATAANPVLSVGGLGARSKTASNTSTNKLLTQSDRPAIWKMAGNSRVISAPGVSPAWIAYAAGTIFDPTWVGGLAKIHATQIGGAVRIYQAGVGQTLLQLIADSTSAVVASLTTASAAGYQTKAWDVFTVGNLTNGLESYSLRGQVAAGAPGVTVPDAWALVLKDA